MMPLPSDPPNELGAKPFLEHLEDLRQVLLRSGGALFIGMLIALPLTPHILSLLKAPLIEIVEDPDRFLRSLEVAGAFSVALRVAFWSGLLLSAPFIVYFVGSFIFPGLTSRERALVKKSFGFAIGLFIFGVLLGYFVTLPVAIALMFSMHGWLGIEAEWTITNYVMFTTHVLIGFGLAFQLPVVVLILNKLRILSATQLRSARRYVVVIVLMLAMILTPPDVVTQLIMAVPLVILYEVCIWIARASERRDAS